jgi:hypothetical protein
VVEGVMISITVKRGREGERERGIISPQEKRELLCDREKDREREGGVGEWKEERRNIG